jgi:hypothetical protein
VVVAVLVADVVVMVVVCTVEVLLVIVMVCAVVVLDTDVVFEVTLTVVVLDAVVVADVTLTVVIVAVTMCITGADTSSDDATTIICCALDWKDAVKFKESLTNCSVASRMFSADA